MEMKSAVPIEPPMACERQMAGGLMREKTNHELYLAIIESALKLVAIIAKLHEPFSNRRAALKFGLLWQLEVVVCDHDGVHGL